MRFSKSSKFLTTVLCLTFALSILSCVEADNAPRSARKLLDFPSEADNLHKQPRSTFSGDKVPSSLFLADRRDYLESLFLIAFGPFVVGVVSLVAGIVYCIFRLGCKKCTANKNSPDAQDSKTSTRVMAILIIAFGVIFLAMIAVGIYGNSEFQPVMTEFFDHAKEEADKERVQIESIEPILNAVNPNRTALRGFVPALTAEGERTSGSVDNAKEYIADNNLWRLLVLCFAYAVLGVILILSGIGIVIRNDKLMLIAGCTCFFGLFLFWFNFGLHYPFSVAVADVCYDIAEAPLSARLEARINSEGDNYNGIDSLLNCPSWSNSNRTYFFINDLRVQLLEDRNFTADPTEIAEINEKLEMLDTIEPVALRVRNCDWVADVLTPFKDDFCGDYLIGLILIWATTLVIAFLMIPYTVFTLILAVRFDVSKDGFF